MSLAEVRSALETALSAMMPALDTAWENDDYVPVEGTPYQQVTLLRGTPSNPEMGPGILETGIFQVNLFFPKNAGPAAAEARAELIRSLFPYGASFTKNGVTVNIMQTPEIGVARPDDDRFMVPVKTRFSAWIGG